MVLLGLPWAVGVAKMTHPAEAAAPVATAPAAPFPDAAASAIAERFAVSYLSWDHDAPTVRSSALVQDVPGLQENDKFGWDGNGHQTAANATTITVTAQSPTVATVTVTAVITPYDAANTPTTQRTEALAVPVEVREGRVVVTGQPASVAVPRPAGSSDTRANRDEDAALASSTAGYATSFFTAYATQDDVSAVAAPSAQIQGLSGIYALKDVRSWTVYAGSGRHPRRPRDRRVEVGGVDHHPELPAHPDAGHRRRQRAVAGRDARRGHQLTRKKAPPVTFQQLILSIIGNLFVLILVIRLVTCWLRKGYGEMITEIVVAVVLFGFVNFPDQSVQILGWIWKHTIAEWFAEK